MPRPSPKSFGDVPLQTGDTSTLGIKVKSRGNAFYFLAGRSALRRYARRFPLTEEGWAKAWVAFAAEDPTGAALYRNSLVVSAHDPAGPAEAGPSRTDDMPEDGWMWVLLGGIGWLGGVGLAYEGVRHVSVVIVLIGATLAFCSMVATLFGVVIEGVRVARRTT